MRKNEVITITFAKVTTLRYAPDRAHHGNEKSLQQIAQDDIDDIRECVIFTDDLQLISSETETTDIEIIDLFEGDKNE